MFLLRGRRCAFGCRLWILSVMDVNSVVPSCSFAVRSVSCSFVVCLLFHVLLVCRDTCLMQLPSWNHRAPRSKSRALNSAFCRFVLHVPSSACHACVPRSLFRAPRSLFCALRSAFRVPFSAFRVPRSEEGRGVYRRKSSGCVWSSERSLDDWYNLS